MTEAEIRTVIADIWRSHQPLAWAGIMVAIVVAMVALVAWPTWQNTDVLRQEKQKSQRTLAVLQQRTTTITQISTEQQRLFGLADIALPLQKQPLLVIQVLQNIAKSTGVNIEKYDLSPGLISTDSAALAASSAVGAGTNSNSTTMNMTMEITGSLDQLRHTMQEMENAVPIYDVIDMSILPMRSGTTEDEANRRYRVAMQIRTFYAHFDPTQLIKSGAQPMTGAQQNMQKKLQSFQLWSAGASASAVLPTSDYNRTDLFGSTSPP